MTNNEINETKLERSKHAIYERSCREWFEVGEVFAAKHNARLDTFVKRMKGRGECSLPRSKTWFCDEDCQTCKFRVTVTSDRCQEQAKKEHGCKSDRKPRTLYESLPLDADSDDGEGGSVSLRDSLPSNDLSMEEILEIEERKAAVRAALDKLDPEEKRLLELIYFENRSEREVTEILQFARQSTLNSRKKALLKRLEPLLKSY